MGTPHWGVYAVQVMRPDRGAEQNKNIENREKTQKTKQQVSMQS
jgi:hypothetical protein